MAPNHQLGAVQPTREIEAPIKAAIRDFYDRLADRRETLRGRNRYYYRLLLQYLRFIVPPGRDVLEVGCGDGYVLRALKPARGLGCDVSARVNGHMGWRLRILMVHTVVSSPGSYWYSSVNVRICHGTNGPYFSRLQNRL